MEKQTRKLTWMAMLVAVSVVLVYLVHFPLFPAAAFLEYDPADIPILIGAMLFGPWAGLVIALVASAIQAFTVSAQSGLYGFLMHFIAAAALCLPAGFIYRVRRNFFGEILALAAGILSMTALMLLANHFITPYFMGVEPAVVDGMMVTVFLPFNLLKAAINSLATFFLFKALSLAHIINK